MASAVDLERVVRTALEQQIGEAQESVLKEAVREFEVQLRQRLARTVLEVSRFYEIHREGERLVITVKLAKGEG